LITEGPIRSLCQSRACRPGVRRTWMARSLPIACVLVVVVSCWSVGPRCLAQSRTTVASAAGASGVSEEAVSKLDPIAEACRLVYEGKFDAAQESAKNAAGFDKDRAELLEQVVQRYRDIARQRQAAREQAFAKHLRELDTLRGAVNLDRADLPSEAGDDPGEPNEPNSVSDVLAVITRAAEFAGDRQKIALMDDPFVKKALQVSIDRSITLEAEGKWLDAYGRYYYWLQAIDPNNHGYSDYADELLAKASIAGSFQNSPCETRKERYNGVEKRMFVRAIDALSLHYVNSIDYVKMAMEGVKRCDVLAEVLTVAFSDGLPDNGNSFTPPGPEKVTAWSVALAGLRDEIETAGASFGKDRFLSILDKVLALNEATVQLPQRPLVAHFSEAALEVLDPYTVMVWPRQVQDFEKLMMNEFTGIGIEITKPRGFLTVASLLPDTPAYRAGLDAGDVIEAVDGVPTKDMSLTCAVKKITGPKGTSVTLGIKRSSAEKAQNITITRDRIIVPTIRGWQRTESGDWLYLVDERNRIGYVRITSFSSDTASDFEDVLEELDDQGLKGLIVDLRFNTGGLLDSAVRISDAFIKEGLIVRTQPKASMIPTYEYAHRRGTQPDYPLVILINAGSASASEIVAGAVGDPRYERATLVGTRTHGKGSVQGITHYPGGGAQLKYTMAYYHLPSGQRVKSRSAVEKEGRKDWGVGADVEVKLTSEELREMLDVQRDNDVLVQAGREEHSASYTKRTIEEALQADPQLAVGLLVMETKLIEADALVAN
jgi:carboxyl-terminal processing protease